MKYKSKVIYFSSTLFVLITAYIIGSVFSPQNVRRRDAETPLFSESNKKQVKSIDLKVGEELSRLRKEGSSWYVLLEDGYPFKAQSSRVEALIDNIFSLKKSKVVDRDHEQWPLFELSEETASRISFYNDNQNQIMELYIGKSSPGGKGIYIRVGEEPQVYQAERLTDYYIKGDNEFWTDLYLLPRDIPGTDVIRLTVKNTINLGEDDDFLPFSYTLFKDDVNQDESRWYFHDKSEFQASDRNVDNWLRTILYLEGDRAESPVDEQFSGIKTPKASLIMTTDQNRNYELRVGNIIGDLYYIKLHDSEYLYTIDGEKLKSIFPSADKLKEE